MARLRRSCCCLVVLCAVAATAGPARAASGCDTDPIARTATVFRVDQCDRARGFDRERFSLFRASWNAYKEPHLGQYMTTKMLAVTALAHADASCEDDPVMTLASVEEFRRQLAIAQTRLERLTLDRDGTRRARPFSAHAAAEAALDTTLAALDAALRDSSAVLREWNIAAAMYEVGDCSGASARYEDASATATQASQELIRSGQQIATDILPLFADCSGETSAVDPMSPTQLDRRPGVTGTRSTSSGGVKLLAPRRLALRRSGRTQLPLDITVPGEGLLEIVVVRGTRELTAVWGMVTRARSGLLVRLPRDARAGKARVVVSFTPGPEAEPTELETALALAR